VWVVLDNLDGKLWAGMFVKATLRLAENPGLLILPKEAIFEEGGEKFVFRAERRHLQPRGRAGRRRPGAGADFVSFAKIFPPVNSNQNWI
jgi:hypothetical protein